MLKTFSKTDIGRKRSMNQDSVYTCEIPLGNLPNLFIVADGMGGHKAGDYASACAVRTIEHEVMMCNEKEPVMILRHAVECANSEVYEKAISEPDYSGMGTTVVAATIIDDIMYVANVGDSRLYLINDDIKQVTKDHSLVEEMIRAGELDRDEARNHPDKNIITRAVGVAPTVMIDFFEVDICKGDRVLLCSDGLTNMIEDDEICRLVKSGRDIAESVTELVKVANHNGGKDNISVIVVEPKADEVSR